MSQAGWIGVDLDGTLAYYDSWRGLHHIGAPIPLMLERVKQWLAEGKAVKVFTARANDAEAHRHIEAWCMEHIGSVLPITSTKDYGMYELWDDRSIQVIHNTGQRADSQDL